MSDIEPMDSDDESRLFESFDQDQIKFNETISSNGNGVRRKKQIVDDKTSSSTGNDQAPNQSVEIYSTTYATSASKKVSKTELTHTAPAETTIDAFDVFDNDSLGLLSDSDKFRSASYFV